MVQMAVFAMAVFFGTGTVSIKKNDEFLRVFKRGRYAAGRHMTVHALPNGTARNRLGLSISRKAGNSVRRNRFRRLLRENHRLLDPSIIRGYDIVMAARPCSGELPDFHEISRETQALFKRLGLLKTTGTDRSENNAHD